MRLHNSRILLTNMRRVALVLAAMLPVCALAPPAGAQLASELTVRGMAARLPVSFSIRHEVLIYSQNGAGGQAGEAMLDVSIERAGEAVMVKASPLDRARGTGDRLALSYMVSVANTGAVPVNDLVVRLGAQRAFGEGKFFSAAARILRAPAGFAAAINPYYDAQNRANLLTSGGLLFPGQKIVLKADLLVAGEMAENRLEVSAGSAADAKLLHAASVRVPAVGDLSAAGGQTDEICEELSGYIFLDSNRDGTRQAHETGIAGVRLSAGSETAQTNRDGRYVLPCPETGANRKLAGFDIVIETESLPPGLGLSGQERRTIRQVFGREANEDFAVSPIPAVTLQLGESDFTPGSVTLSIAGLRKVRRIAGELETVRGRLVVAPGLAQDEELSAQRGAFVRNVAGALWEQLGNPYPLAITVVAGR